MSRLLERTRKDKSFRVGLILFSFKLILRQVLLAFEVSPISFACTDVYGNLCLGCRVAQVRVVFTLPEKVRALLFGIQQDIPQHLAYVEWFSAFKRHPEPNHLMYKVTRSVDRDGHRISAVIPVTSIRQGVQLFPDFGPVAPAEWTSSNVLESCKAFFVSDFSSRHAYHTVI